LIIGFTAAPDGAKVSAFAATVSDPATGQSWNCFAAPRAASASSSCTVPGLVNGTAYAVTGIAGNDEGNSPVAGPVAATPLPVPTPGRIVNAVALGQGRVSIRVTPSTSDGGPLTLNQVRCTPIAGGETRTAAIDGRRVVLTGLRPTRHACVVRAENAYGVIDSSAVRVKVRR
jgi:hypothetical protein